MFETFTMYILKVVAKYWPLMSFNYCKEGYSPLRWCYYGLDFGGLVLPGLLVIELLRSQIYFLKIPDLCIFSCRFPLFRHLKSASSPSNIPPKTT